MGSIVSFAEPVKARTVRAEAPPRALTTRFLDFWLLGGASVVVWAAMWSMEGLRSAWAVDQHFRNLAVTSLSLALLVNYPHFLMSYKLAYGRGSAFVRVHWWQLLAVPVALVGLFVAVYAYYDVPAESIGPLAATAEFLRGYGVNAQVVVRPRLGEVLLTGAFHLMVFTIGWHYTKQVFGCMMVYAHFDGYPFSASQRRLLRGALFSIWGMSLVDFNLDGTWRAFGAFSYSSFDLPNVLGPLAQVAVVAGFLLVCYRVFYVNHRATGQWPSLNLLVPFVAIYLWWMPLMRQEEFYFLLAPFFHSLQYLAFVFRMEDSRLRGGRRREARATATIVFVLLAGWLAFEFVPTAVDDRLGTFDAWGLYFCFTAAMLFINIHHYFIDNALWRFRDPEVRRLLLD